MKIPEKVKIGGKTYTVKITDNISLGRVGYSAEIDYAALEIRILPCAKEKMEADFLHEVMHGIFSFLGYGEHDEKHIDELAQSLYMVIQDNPDAFNGDGKRKFEALEAAFHDGDMKIQSAIDRVDHIVTNSDLKPMLSRMREDIHNTMLDTLCVIRELIGGVVDGTEE